jgi:hypothetical protein
MAGILPELANECEAKRDRLIKDITNVDRSSVIPDHYNKSKSILELVDEAKNEHDRASFIRRMMTTEEQFSSDTNK